MKVYIAGPMRGIPYFNFPAFDRCRDRLLDMGHYVMSPADIDRQLGLDETEFPTGELDGQLDVKDLYIRDHVALLQCDAIALLRDWEKSTGARMEFFGALFLGHTVMCGVTLEIYSDPQEVVEGFCETVLEETFFREDPQQKKLSGIDW